MKAANRNLELSAPEKLAMLRLLDGKGPGTITQALYFFDLHMPRALLLPSLEWLDKNSLRGEKLSQMLDAEFQNDYLAFQQWLTAKVFKEDPRKFQLIAGKSFTNVFEA